MSYNPRIGNYGSVQAQQFQHVVASKQESLAAYDALPKRMREALASSSLSISPLGVQALIDKHGLEAVLIRIKTLEAVSFGPAQHSNIEPPKLVRHEWQAF